MQQTELTLLRQWLEDYLPATVAMPAQLQLAPLDGDAGFRRYFRLNTSPSLMAVYAPPNHENNPAFVSKALTLQAHGIHTPRVYAVDYRNGFMLLEDLGDDLYARHLSLSRSGNGAVEALYDTAEQTLLCLQQVPADTDIFPLYDEAQLQQEMSLFPEWFVGGLLKLELRSEERELLSDTFTRLTDNALQQPQVIVHRDFHSRNLMLLPNNGVGVLDFQDGVVGAVTYDLVSLLKDCYRRQPPSWVEQRALSYAQRLRDIGLLIDVEDRQFLRWFDLMGLQRHIKVLGIFARLWLRDGKTRYLQDLPLALRYAFEVAGRYEELHTFDEWMRERLLPALPLHEWYRDWKTAGE